MPDGKLPDEEADAWIAAAAQPRLDRDRIRAIFMDHGFTIKEGQSDLKEYVYDAANALLAEAALQPPERWREEQPDGTVVDVDPADMEQPARKPLFAGLIAQHEGLAEELAAQPVTFLMTTKSEGNLKGETK